MLLAADFTDLSPRTFFVTAAVSAVAVAVPWAAIYTVFAATELSATSALIGSVLTLLITELFKLLTLRENNRKLTAIQDVIGKKPTPDSPTLVEQAGTAAVQAAQAATAAKTAVRVAVVSDEKADERGKVLAEVARHSNGEFAAMKAERDALRKRVETLERSPRD